jgi:hypothetical protein
LDFNLRSCEYWSAILTSRPPGDISVRTILKLFSSCAIGSSVGASPSVLLLSSQPTPASLVILFSAYILKVYNTWSHWLSGLYPSSAILNTGCGKLTPFFVWIVPYEKGG